MPTVLKGLDPSLKAWIMQVSGLGPGLGRVQYLVPVGSTTSLYNEWLRRDMNVHESDVHHTLVDGENALTANRNDVLLVMPGTYTQTARLAWDKDHTHMIGLGGPNNEGDHSLSGVTIYCATLDQVETIDIDADRCIFINLLIGNGANDADSLAAVNVNGWGNYFKSVKFIGTIGATQNTTPACCSLSIDQLGHFPIFEDCIIGQNGWGVRSGANSGVLRFIGTTAPAPQNGRFTRCQFLSRSETAAVAMVATPANTCIDRTWLFEDCVFSNFSINNVNALSQAFYNLCGTTHSIILKGCAMHGITEWETVAGSVRADMPTPAALGGIVVAST